MIRTFRTTVFKTLPEELEAIETEFANSEKALQESDAEDAWDAAENAFEDLRAGVGRQARRG